MQRDGDEEGELIPIPDTALASGSEMPEEVLASGTTHLHIGILMLIGFAIWGWLPLIAPAGAESAAYFLDVGQGDAQLVELASDDGAATILIDGGRGGQVLSGLADVLGARRRIDLVVVSHPDADHFGGLIDVVRAYDVGAVITSGVEPENDEWRIFMDEVAARGIPLHALGEGDRIRYGDSRADVLWPTGDARHGNSTNEASLVMMLTAAGESGDMRALFTGDIGHATEEKIVAAGHDLDADVLKVAHHGSKNSSSAQFIAAVAPEISVIGVGKNGYGHPSEEALSVLEQSGSLVFTTLESGTIKVPLRRDAPRTAATKSGLFAAIASIFTGSWQSTITSVSLADAEAEGGDSTLVPYAECSFDEPVGFRDGPVRFNEIAWMGGEGGAAHEWIELATGGETDLTGWQVVNGNGRLHATFPQGSVFEDEFLILARGAANDALDLRADLLFTGSIRNSNEALRLFDSECYVVDEVAAVPSWPGGDNGGKRTMERTADGLWGTSAEPGGTPRAENTASDGVEAAAVTNRENDEDTTGNEEESESSVIAHFSQDAGTFRVDIQASDLTPGEYDVKASLIANGAEISETFDARENRWRSSLYYVSALFSGESYNGALSLRLKEQYSDFSGPAQLSVRVRKAGSSSYTEYAGAVTIAPVTRIEEEEKEQVEDPPEAQQKAAPTASVQHPSMATVGEEFAVSVAARNLDAAPYDVKITVESGGLISRTLRDGVWTSSQYYVANALQGPEGMAQLRLMVPEQSAAEARLIVRLRKSGSSTSFVAYEGAIAINPAPAQEPAPEEESEPEPLQEEMPEPQAGTPPCININTASESELDAITGIGPALATRIVEARAETLFSSLDDLVRVSGIGPATVEKIKTEGLACAS